MHRLAHSFWLGRQRRDAARIELIEIRLARAVDGTLLRLRSTGMSECRACADHEAGWAHDIGRLAVVAAGRDLGPDPRARSRWQGVTVRPSLLFIRRLRGRRLREARALSARGSTSDLIRSASAGVAGL